MAGVTRRRFIQAGMAGAGALGIPWLGGISRSHASPGGKLAKYLEPVPRPGAGIVVAQPSGANTYSFTCRQIFRRLHPQLPETPVWAYDDGQGLAGQAGAFSMAIVAQSGIPVTVRYTHALPDTYPDWLPVDTRLTPGNTAQVRMLSHLHGGFVSADSDGSPALRPGGFARGETQTAFYPNEAAHTPASMLWFHDHALGATRLNVLAGLAGAYIVRDAYDTGLETNPIGLPGGDYELPLVIQDRLFNADGTFLYPRSDIPGVNWIGEYFGDVMLVNGKAWPYCELEPRLYRLRFLNGCNARILNLDMGGVTFWQIGAEQGLFDVPVPLRELVLAPAERADVLVDFSKFAGNTLMLKNHRPRKPAISPAPQLEAVMEIRVGGSARAAGAGSILRSLPGLRAELPPPVSTRYITLNEAGMDTSSWMLNLNGARFDEPATESPRQGTVEDWVYINLTDDTHPMHVHLVRFQVVGRTPFNAHAYAAAYAGRTGVSGAIDPGPYATGAMEPPAPEERGYKDTVKVNPGYFTTIRMRFDLPDNVAAPQAYVHHCHILEHEDNDMMRPFIVTH